MKFGFEHDRFSDEENERTPLLATSNVAPTADPAVAAATTETSTTVVNSSSTLTTTSETTKVSSQNGHHSSSSSASTAIEPSGPSSAEDRATSDKPLPINQILILCVARFVEPVVFFSIFPYINYMIVRNAHVQPSDTGFYAGLIESLFSVTQILVMIFWGRLSDRYGRKPILVISLTGIALATAPFGFSQTIWQMVLFRCIAGTFAGTIVTIRTMITEHSTAKTQARAFSWFAFSGNMGILLGPLIGGALADPNKLYPRIFKNSHFFQHYPYSLSTMATAGIAVIAAVMVAMFAEETLPPTSAVSNKSDPESNGNSNASKEDTSIKSIIKASGIKPVLYIYSHVMVLGLAFTAIAPVFMYEPIALGGFGFSSLQISMYMSLMGATQAIWLLFIFPPLQRRIGTGGVLRACAYAWPVFFAFLPFCNFLLRQRTKTTTTLFWIVSPTTLSVGVGVSMAFTAVQLALNDVAPSPRTMATLNAIALTLVTGIRTVVPAVFPSILAVGVRYQILWGYLVWLVVIVLALLLILGLRLLPEKAEGRIYEHIQNDEREDS